MLTKIDVQNRLAAIRSNKGNAEAAHCLEDALHLDALTAIASGDCDDARGIARLAASSKKIQFPRFAG